MDTPEKLNAAIACIERELCGKPDIGEAARLACVSVDSFERFFSYMTGMSLKEYIRRRRLTLAAQELRRSPLRIIDIAVKYGYDSADAFAKAFAKQHGISPAAYRRHGGRLRVYPPASFHIIIKGANEMDMQIFELPETEVFGAAKQFDGEGYRTREELRHRMWSADCDDVPGHICEGRWNQPGSHAYDGVWYGIWQNGKYRIAREAGDAKDPSALEKFTLPAGTYAAFRTGRGGVAWEEFPRLFAQIFECWLPDSGYRHKGDLAIEVLHLQTDHDERQKNRWYEVWIPVEAV
ncbi:MAG: AraC family transcriptional regulator [Oscillospiraceae bacterium]|nr:AraC family transcriptional regulator [Oscillospiraceae bacterium]